VILNVLNIPFGCAQLLSGYNSNLVSDSNAYRPDRIMADSYGDTLLNEMACNELSVKSPVELSQGSDYVTLTTKFLSNLVSSS
jgi:hypothetical protein